ncbi:uncharacterized protein LOC124269664 [Haliotis rubra]|uniref:uncharacterized protein LOC124269664 n=1 Tax=Haliotis rubra TaxID=36100 RepID=UPI001EE5DD17|nr:uncharacterized protein LOC124269664 [Haliotis rubra]
MILNQEMASLWMVLIDSIILWSAQFVTVSTESLCPEIAHLSGSYNISAKIVYDHFVWVRPSDNQNVVTCSPACSGTTTYSATQKNTENITTLTIGRVQFGDAGTWVISNTSSRGVPACYLTVAGLPNCAITSSLSYDSLEPNSELTLVANIRGYYCSKQAGFELITGRDVPEVLLKNHTVTDVTDIVLSSTFNVTLKRLGNVQLDFTCDNATFNLPCHGVSTLLKSPPECDISSSRNGSLIPGTSLTLTVNITNYYCTEEAAFDLITGSVQQELVPRHHVVDINSTVVSETFEVTSVHDGDVKVNFKCGGIHRELSCDGDKKIIVVSTECPAIAHFSGSYNISAKIVYDRFAWVLGCDISSSRNGSLIPGTSLTLTVNITNYYCTEEAAFDLITGSVQQELVPRHHVVRHINSTVVSETFEVTSVHDGDVKSTSNVAASIVNLAATATEDNCR